MLGNITLGQFIPGKSFLHKIDPRSKIIFVISFIVLIFFCNTYISSFVMLLSVFIVMFISQIKIKNYFKSMKMILFIVIFTSLMNLFYSQDNPIFEFGFIKITETGISNSVFVAIRLISLIMISSVLTFTTSPNDLTDAIEWILIPLKIFKVDVHSIAMMMTIALRFVPTLLEETDKIMNAQKSRGGDIESGNIIERTKALVPILVPLFVSAFRRAYDLAMAMECRCYKGGEGRTRMKILRFSFRDIISFAAIVLLYLVVLLWC